MVQNKAVVEEKRLWLVDATSQFCEEYLDNDYRELCAKLVNKMARKRNVPFLTGRPNIWAAATVHALGQINFLYDQSFEPYASLEDICDFFGASKSTVTGKAKTIRDMFKMDYYDPDFSTKLMKDSDPFSNCVSIDGLIVPVDMLPLEIRKAIKNSRSAGD